MKQSNLQDIYQSLQPSERTISPTFKTQLRIHILGAAYGVSSKEMICSPFVQRTVKMPSLFQKLGHHVIHYGHCDSVVDCSEHVSVTDDSVLEKCYGKWDRRQQPPNIRAGDSAFKHFQENAEIELRKRIQPDDIVLSLFGWGDKDLFTKLKDLPCHLIEASIGYPDSFHTHRVFQSPSKMCFERGRSSAVVKQRAMYPTLISDMKEKYPDKDRDVFREWERLTENEPDVHSTVIPPMSDPNDFDYNENKSDYMLFIGRVHVCKGLELAIKLSEYTGDRLIVAGPITKKDKQGKPLPFNELVNVPIPKQVEYIGIADLDKRRELYRDAKLFLGLSRFLEPGHNTHIETALSGTPSILSNHGIQMDYFWQGKAGWLCHPDDFSDVVNAYEKIGEIKPSDCLQYGLNFGLDRISLFYHEWLHKTIRNHHRDFWEVLPTQYRTNLKWLDPKPIYPYPEQQVKDRINEIRNQITLETSD